LAPAEAALAELIDALPDGVAVTDAEKIEKDRWDRSQDPHTRTTACPAGRARSTAASW